MLIKINEVGKLIGRHKSAVYKYIEMGILSAHILREKKSKTQFWRSDDVKLHLDKVRRYQTNADSDKRATPKPKKSRIDVTIRPPETPGQLAANNAFNLCLNIA